MLRTMAMVLGGALLASGCAHHEAYDVGSPTVAHGSLSVALSVLDLRESVRAGGNPAFVGLSHGGWGPGVEVTTASGRPLAQDLAASIRRGLEAAGYRVTPVRVPARARQETIIGTLTRAGAERLLAVEILVWKADTWMRTQLDCEMTLRVFDTQGRELGRARVTDSLVQSSETDYLLELEHLLNDRAIKRALAPAPSPPPESAPPEAAPAQSPDA